MHSPDPTAPEPTTPTSEPQPVVLPELLHALPPTDDVPETVIEPASGWQLLDLGELWRYRELLLLVAWRDVSVRYKQTALGAAWAVFQPVLMMAVFWMFFGKVAKVETGPLPYALFVYAGLLPWFLFGNSVAGAANSLLDSERLISKVYFPRLLIPFAAVGPAVVDFLVAVVVLIGLIAANGVAPGWTAVFAPLAVGMILMAALGVGALLSALSVAYRDFRHVVPFLVQAWLFATPSIYLSTPRLSADVPEVVRWAMTANPMTGLIAFFRASLFGDELPWMDLGVSAAVSVGFFTVGCLYFRRVEDSFADEI